MRRVDLTVAGTFFLLAVLLSGVLPLWLDEIIQLRETRNTTPAQLIASLPGQPGAAPLGYLIQQTSLRITGYSVRWARFPSALFVAGSVFIVGLLGAEFGLKKPWVGAAIFAVLPITLRYGSESRIYSQALLFSTLATFLFVRLLKNCASIWAVFYCMALAAAIYTQPYAVFVGAAHCIGAALDRKWKAAWIGAFTNILAVAAFLPWYLRAKAVWSAGIAGARLHFVLGPKTPLMLFREIAGAGYWGSGLLLILCALAFTKRTQFSRRLSLLILWIAVPVALALAADGSAGYFVATRQILWIVPAIVILAALGIDRNPRVALPVAALLVAFCVWQNIRDFTATRENWEIAADAIANEVSQGACLMVVPMEQQYSYEFFRPELAQTHCPARRIAVAITPYASQTTRNIVLAGIAAQGYTRQSAADRGRSEILVFTR